MSVPVIAIVTPGVIQDPQTEPPGSKTERLGIIAIVAAKVEKQTDRETAGGEGKIRERPVLVVAVQINDNDPVGVLWIVLEIVDVVSSKIQNKSIVSPIVVVARPTDLPARLAAENFFPGDILGKVAGGPEEPLSRIG